MCCTVTDYLFIASIAYPVGPIINFIASISVFKFKVTRKVGAPGSILEQALICVIGNILRIHKKALGYIAPDLTCHHSFVIIG